MFFTIFGFIVAIIVGILLIWGSVHDLVEEFFTTTPTDNSTTFILIMLFIGGISIMVLCGYYAPFKIQFIGVPFKIHFTG